MTEDAPLLRFGLIADPQYAPLAPIGTRYFANSLWKLSEAIAELNMLDLAFVATLGDFIDRGWESFGHVLPLYGRLRHPHHPVPGNHDFDVAPEHVGAVRARLGRPEGYYDFAVAGHRFIVIDGTEISLYATAPGSPEHALARDRLAALQEARAPNAQTWNGSLGPAQLAWLGGRLAAAGAAGERVIVLGHFPIHPTDPHMLWDSPALLDLLCGHDHVLAYFCGHNHVGNYGSRAGRHFVNLKGMVETATETAYAVVAVHRDRLEVQPRGSEVARILPIG
jgi:hypothetical protein